MLRTDLIRPRSNQGKGRSAEPTRHQGTRTTRRNTGPRWQGCDMSRDDQKGKGVMLSMRWHASIVQHCGHSLPLGETLVRYIGTDRVLRGTIRSQLRYQPYPYL